MLPHCPGATQLQIYILGVFIPLIISKIVSYNTIFYLSKYWVPPLLWGTTTVFYQYPKNLPSHEYYLNKITFIYADYAMDFLNRIPLNFFVVGTNTAPW